MTTPTGEPLGTNQELNLVCRPRHGRNLYLMELALRALAPSFLAYLIAKKGGSLRDTVEPANAVLKAVPHAVIRQGKRTKRTRLKTNTCPCHKHFLLVKKPITQELRDATNKCLVHYVPHRSLQRWDFLPPDQKLDVWVSEVYTKATQFGPSARYGPQFLWLPSL